MAREDEIRLGRLVVQRGFATDEQVLAALRARNERPDGPDLGALLVARGLVPQGALALLAAAAARGEGAPAVDRHEASTDHAIALGSTREVIARASLEEALALPPARREEALRELRRLAADFPDTQSGNEARAAIARLEGAGA